jgi:ABC-type transport system involved in multi-copper enzyme maturation permease subunit
MYSLRACLDVLRQLGFSQILVYAAFVPAFVRPSETHHAAHFVIVRLHGCRRRHPASTCHGTANENFTLKHHFWTIGRLTLLEARRNRLLWIAGLVVLAGFALAQFLAQVALTETQPIRITVLAALFRLAAAFMIANFVVASAQRDFADKGVELTLALPVARASFCLGKLLGFALCAAALAALFAAALWLGPGAEPARAALWGAALAAELAIVAAMGLFCAFTLASSTGAIAAVVGFYLLARSVGAMQVIAASPLAEENGALHTVINQLVGALSLLLPRLDLFARSEWLTGTAPSGGELAIVFGQAVLYLALLAAASLFDFYRREL